MHGDREKDGNEGGTEEDKEYKVATRPIAVTIDGWKRTEREGERETSIGRGSVSATVTD